MGELSFEIDLTELKEELSTLQDISESIKKLEQENKNDELPSVLAQYAKNLEGVVATVQKSLEFSVMRKEESFKRHKVLEDIRDNLKNFKPEKQKDVDFSKVIGAIEKLSFEKFIKEIKTLTSNKVVSIDNFNDMPLAQGGATASNQAAILAKLTELIASQGDISVDADAINLNTDDIEDKLDDIIENQTKTYDILIAVDSGDANITYIGKAVVGSLTSASVWQIKVIDKTSGTSIKFLNDDSTFTQEWDERET